MSSTPDTWKAPSDDTGQSTTNICTDQKPFFVAILGKYRMFPKIKQQDSYPPPKTKTRKS